MTGTEVPLALSADTGERLVRNYEWLHQHPELSMAETRTASYIEAELRGLGLEPQRCGETGIVAVLDNGVGPVVAFRADMDGLPMAEQTGLDYASEMTGIAPDGSEVPVTHGCGHDAHVAMALAALRHLLEHRGTWSGSVVFIFQPGEETAEGARSMADAGLWTTAPVPDVLLAQHVTPTESGTVQISTGPAFSMADTWSVRVHGRQGHAARPHKSVDPIVLAAHIVVRLQSIVSRETDPLESAVITVGAIHAGFKDNIIPAYADLTINVRTFLPEVRQEVLDSVRGVLVGEARISGAPEPDIVEDVQFPASLNSAEGVERVLPALRAAVGDEHVSTGGPALASEDIGNLTTGRNIPLVYWRLGCISRERLAAGVVPGNHSPQFAPDQHPTLEAGTRAAVAAISTFLSPRSPSAPGSGEE